MQNTTQGNFTKPLPPIKNTNKNRDDINRNVMAVGPLGVGKTTQFLTLPGKKFLYVFDPNALESLEGADIDYLTFIPDKDDLTLAIQTLRKEGGKVVGDRPRDIEPLTYVKWEEDFHARVEAGFFSEYQWVGFDSATTFSDIIMDRVLYLNKRQGKQPEFADHAAEMNTMKNVFRVVAGFDCNLWVTAHTEEIQDETTKRISRRIMFTGKNRVRIPLMFGNIFCLWAEETKDKGYFTARTIPDRLNPVARTTSKTLKPLEDVTIDFKKPLVGQGIASLLARG